MTSMNMKQQLNLSSKFEQVLQEFHPNQMLSALAAGLILGIINITLATSFAALVFSGELSEHVSKGIGLALFSAFVVGLVIVVMSSFPGMIGGLQDSPAAILALVATTTASCLPASTSPENAFFTVVTLIIMTSLLTGTTFLVLGMCKLGNLIRFIPYPVIGGFLAGTGWLMVKGAIEMMTGRSASLFRLSSLFQSELLVKWLPGCILGIILLVVLRRYHHILIMPAMIFTSIGLFYVVLLLTNISPNEAGAQGWLMGPFPEGGLWQPFILSAFSRANWSVIVEHIGSIGAILIVSVISLLLNASGLELIVQRDIELNRELQAAGIANLIASIGGGLIGYHVLGDTALGYRMAPHKRLTGIFSAILCGGALVWGASLLSFFPKFVAGSLVLFLGLSFLVEWVYDAWFTLPKTDYFLVLLILAIIGTFGFLEGVTLGIMVAVVLFVVKYSRINVVKQVLSRATYQSNVDRAVPYQRLLQEKGEQLLILKLQGFLFFGTADNLLNQVRQRVMAPDLPELRFVVLDFRLVTGLDSSALNSFAKMERLAKTRNIIPLLTHLSPQIRQQFENRGYLEQDDSVFRIFSDLDHGIEWCENQILMTEDKALADMKQPGQDLYGETFLESIFEDLMKFLDKQELFESIVTEMISYFERQEVKEGAYLIHRGDPPEALYFIESGQVTVQLEHEDGKMTRLRTMGAGTVVGELGLYLGQKASASVMVQQPGTVYRLSIDALHRMQEKEPQIAMLFHEFMARHLGERLANINAILQAVLD